MIDQMTRPIRARFAAVRPELDLLGPMARRPLSPSRFFVWFGATVAALAGLAIGLCVAVDPYRMYGTPVLPGWTELKPQIYDQIDLAATYQLERVRPITLLLGNSRVEVGINPESPIGRRRRSRCSTGRCPAGTFAPRSTCCGRRSPFMSRRP